MRRGLRFLVDPEPDPEEKRKCIEFFGHGCAYCGTALEKGRGDFDHLVSAALGGRNHISNRVFTCKPCNAEQKRDKQWEEFLRERHGSGPAFETTRRKILGWVAVAGAMPPIPETLIHLLNEEGAKITAAYDEACQRVRRAQPNTPIDGLVAAPRHQGCGRAIAFGTNPVHSTSSTWQSSTTPSTYCMRSRRKPGRPRRQTWIWQRTATSSLRRNHEKNARTDHPRQRQRVS